MPIKGSNDTLNALTIPERLDFIFNCYSAADILVTSSFGATAAFLLYHLSQRSNKPDIYFLNTGFHFSTTLKYRDELANFLKLNIVEVKPNFEDHSFTEYEKLWESDADACCNLNKVKPLDTLKKNFKEWMTGLMSVQTPSREKLSIIEKGDSILKFNPLFDENPNHVLQLLKKLEIPLHPLIEKGYDSLGCLQCTGRGNGRSGRWPGMRKTEYGLHTK